jgi:predicted RNA methylase
MSPIEFFKSDSDLKRGIAKSLALNGKITDSNLRTICRDEDASSMITNFPPRVAIGIIKEMTSDMKPQVGINGFSLLDPCSGFSGRLIGSCASGKIRRYVGIDLSPHTYAGLIKTEEFMRRQGCDVEIELHQADCIKKMAEMDEKFDLIMTSPPFLDVPFESDYSKWRVEFIKPFVELCFSRLKNEGKLAVYSENITKNKALSNDLSLFAKEAGFIEQKSINFKKTPGAYNLAKRNFRITSIKVWKRP